MVSTKERRKIGKRNRISGRNFELRIRKDLEKKGFVVSKWMNNVEFPVGLSLLNGKKLEKLDIDRFPAMRFRAGKLIPAKHKFRGKGIPMAIGTGFPDFIAFKKVDLTKNNNYAIFEDKFEIKANNAIIGVEVKSNGYLDKEENKKCQWLIDNNIFSTILIAKKGKKRGLIEYNIFK